MINDSKDFLSLLYITTKHFIYLPISFVYIVNDPKFPSEPGGLFIFTLGRSGWFSIGFFVLICELSEEDVPTGTWTREAFNWLTFRKGECDISKSAITLPYTIVILCAFFHLLGTGNLIELLFVSLEIVEYVFHMSFFLNYSVEDSSAELGYDEDNIISTRTIMVQETITNTIQSLPPRNSNNFISQIYNKKEEICSICLDNIKTGDEYYETVCSHTFHYDCLYEWSMVSINCPICRNDIINA